MFDPLKDFASFERNENNNITVSSPGKYSYFGLSTGVVCLVALYIHLHREGRTTAVDRILMSIQGTLQQNFFYFQHGGRSFFDHYLWLVDTKKKNEQMERELAVLRSRVIALEEVENENGRLKRLLDTRESLGGRMMSAQVVAYDVSPDFFGIRIDRGARDGIRLGMGVISPWGVVGRIQRVSSVFSDVVTLLDPTSQLDAIIHRSRVRGIVTGQSRDLSCKVRYIDKLDDVKVDDILVSSGFRGIFPKGLPIGTVTAVIPGTHSVLQTVLVKSSVDIHRLEEVSVVIPPDESETLPY